MITGEKQQAILSAALTGGRFDDDGEVQSRRAATKLHMAGYLARDPKDGSVWYPTDAARAVAQELAIKHGELRQLIDRAAATLSEAANAADVLDARDQARFAYDAAKATARLAAAKGAHDAVVARSYRLQADAAEIEYLAKKRLADEYDAAQARGEVASGSVRTDIVPHGNDVRPATAEQIGLSRKDVFEARQIRDAIASNPDAVREVLDDLLERGAEPTKAAIKRALTGIEGGGRGLKANIGTKTATQDERGDNLYETPIEAMRALLALESFSAVVWEPSCGRGAIVRPLEAAGYDVVLSDLVDYATADQYGELQKVGDFLLSEPVPGADIVTNPPYGECLNAYMAHALRVHKPEKMALLLNYNAWLGFADDDRNFAMSECPPSRIYAFAHRLPMMHRDGYTGPKAESSMNTAWFIWERNADGSYGRKTKLWGDEKPDGPVLYRIVWDDFMDSEPLAPGASSGRAPVPLFGAAAPVAEPERETPRRTEEERIEIERAGALLWMAGRDNFSAKAFQVGFAIRPLIADRLIETFLDEGLIVRVGGDDFRVSDGGHLALAAAAGALVADMTADDVEAFGKAVAHG